MLGLGIDDESFSFDHANGRKADGRFDAKRIDGICRDAPHVIIAHGPEINPTSQASCTIALTYLELAAALLPVAQEIAHGLSAIKGRIES